MTRMFLLADLAVTTQITQKPTPATSWRELLERESQQRPACISLPWRRTRRACADLHVHSSARGSCHAGGARGEGAITRHGSAAREDPKHRTSPLSYPVARWTASSQTQTHPNRLHTHTHPPKRLAHPRSPIPPLSTLTSRATHAHPTSPRSTGFCAIRDCISSSSSSCPSSLVLVAALHPPLIPHPPPLQLL